MVSVGHRP